jgi:tetratricopeptide (TPR) repeat protein
MHRGYCFGLLGRYDLSAKLLEQAEKKATESSMRELRCEVLLRRAMLSFLRRDYADADRLYRIVLNECQEVLDWYLHCGALAGIGKVLMIRGYFDEAIPWLEESFLVA